MEIQQSSLYATYIRSLGWRVEKLEGSYVFLRRFPLIGTIAKLQRFEKLPNKKNTIAFLKQWRVRTFAPEPEVQISRSGFSSWIRTIKSHAKINNSPFLPTKTILVDLRLSEDDIFRNFSEAKRRAVRKAQKLGVTVEESKDIDAMIDVKKKSAGLFGFMVVANIPQLWRVFAPKHATILLARHPSSPRPVGGILLLFWNNRALYWLVGATKLGKTYAVPTLLVWEALRMSKKRGMKEFDFLGVNDERLPKDNPSWRGFTKFKEGFGGAPLYYPTNL